MTKLKPIKPYAIQEMQDTLGALKKLNEEVYAIILDLQERSVMRLPSVPISRDISVIQDEATSCTLNASSQTVPQTPSKPPRLKPDFSADRYSNGLRIVKITGVDGRKMVHRYWARGPVGSMHRVPPISTGVHTQTIESSAEAEQVVHVRNPSLSAISMDYMPPFVYLATRAEVNEDGTPRLPATSSLKIMTPSPTVDVIDNGKAWLSFDSEYICRRIGTALTIPIIFLFVGPWAESTYFVLPWFVSRVFHILLEECELTVDKLPVVLRGPYNIFAMLLPILSRTIALSICLVALGLPGLNGGGVHLWAFCKVVGLLIFPFYSLPAFTLQASVIWIVWKWCTT